jgi:uncharacterized HAD superfamily protein
MLKIGFDIDGVLANFCHSYEDKYKEVTGVNRFAPWHPDVGPLTWNWPTEHYGYTKEQTDEVWRRIKADPNFWEDLPSAPGFMQHFKNWFISHAHYHEVYFVTARPGTRTKRQTENWFHRRLLTVPTMLISDQKGMVARALNLDYYVDDKAENIADVVKQSPHTKAYLLDKAYNRHMNPGGVRLANLEEFLQVLNGVM